jgi:hypothetical protein
MISPISPNFSIFHTALSMNILEIGDGDVGRSEVPPLLIEV